MNKAIFLDRDGVICKEKNLFYMGAPITKPEHFEWEECAREGIHELSKLEDFLVVVVTNQPGISRGLLTEEDLSMINQPIYDDFKKNGGNLNGFYFCPHTAEEGCECRKPNTGMLLRAKEERGISLKDSYVVGDNTMDIEMGRRVGCKTILVKTGYGGRDCLFSVEPDFTVKNLLEAVDKIK